jgi:hypothetical protein
VGEGKNCHRKNILKWPFLSAVLDDYWLLSVNRLSGITFPTPDTPTLTIFASLLMSNGMVVRPYPSCILIRLSSLGDTHLLAGTQPQRCQL